MNRILSYSLAVLILGGIGINDAYAATPVAPVITTQPVDATVTAPAKATFKVVATGTPKPTYQWMESVNSGAFTSIASATSASYVTAATALADSGTQYECVVSNSSGSVTSSIATLTVDVKPAITTQPASMTVISPAAAVFTVVASGAPAPGYQWEQAASGSSTYTAIPGAMDLSYSTDTTTLADSGTKYKCVISNAAGSVTSTAATLTVQVMPSITAQPSDASVIAPAKAIFTVTASGTPALAYQWMQSVNGGAYTNITGATRASYTTAATTTTDSGTLYECVVTNAAGSVTSNPAALTVNPAVAPSITAQPVNETAVAPASATFTVSATGTPAPTYQWQQEASGAKAYTAVTGATGASYTTPATTAADSGTKFRCVVKNSAGSVTSAAAVLTVVTSIAPSITTQPVNATVTTPATAVFTVAAAGTPSPTYQWQSEAPGATSYTAISGATGTNYTTPATTIAESGTNYECVVTNSAGTVTSNAVSLTVNPVAPVATIVSPADQSTFTTGSISITAIVQGSISNVSFYNGSTLLGTVTSTSQAFTYPWANVPAGTYNLTAVATSITGATGSSSPVTVTINSSPFTYAVDDNILTKTDALNHTTSFQYDNLNRLLKITFADTSTVSYAYDLFGNQISVTDQRGNTLTKTYDAYDRLSQTKDPNNGLTQFSYDTDSRLLQLTDADGHATNYTYDPNGKVLTQTNALNFTTAFTYDPAGNAATRTDANNKTTNYTYDALNHLTGITYPDNTSVTNVYDALSRKTSMTDATGQTSYTYDALNRLLSKSAPGFNSTITYTYDGEGNRLTSVDQNNRTISNTYDTLNRLSSVQDPNGTTSYGYDAVSNEVSVTSPNGVTENYTYDALNRLLSAVNRNASAGVISSFTNVYDVAGMITQKTYSDGSWDTYTYDALNQLLSETKQTSSSVVYGNVYSYDAVGNRLSLTKNTTLGEFWSVDSLNMPAQTLSNMTGAGYGSTANPNQAVSLARSYSNDATNRLTGWSYAVNVNASSFPVQTDTYTYDNNGNRLSKQAVLTGQTGTPQQTSYAYDFENRLNQLQYTNIPNITGTQTDSLFYNGEGLRMQAVLNNVTSAYLYDGMNILVEKDGSGNTTKSYTRGLDFGGGIGSLIAQNNVGTGAVQYYDYDDLGSVADLTTSTGTTAASYSYDAFGNLLTAQSANDTNRYLFSTKELDARSGLEYFGARYYDPEVGRWLTTDPLGFTRSDFIVSYYVNDFGIPLSIGQYANLYAFIGNSPLNYLDPYGLWQHYKNWGGSDWSDNTNKYGDEDKGKFPREGQPGYVPPADARDECYYEHDVCLADCAKVSCDDDRQQCRRQCDVNLSMCLNNLHGKYGDTSGEEWLFGPSGSPNDDPGKYYP